MLKRTRYLITFFISLCTTQSFAQTLDIISNFHIGKAIAEGHSNINILIAAREGGYKDLIRYIKENKYQIKFYAEDLEYVRISIPIKDVNNVAKLDLVEAVNTETNYPPLYYADNNSPRNDSIPKRSLKQLFDDHRIRDDLTDLQAMGLMELRKAYPYADGSGVVIAHIEGFIDPETPEMKYARSLDGRRVPKILAIHEANNYMSKFFPHATSEPGYRGVKMKRVTLAPDNSFNIGGRVVRTPGPGQYWAGLVDETDYQNADRDFNKDGNPKGALRTYVIARKQGEDCFWVDTNQNNDLNDDICLGDYNTIRQTGRFPAGSPDKIGTRFYILESSRPDKIIFATPESHPHLVATTAVGSPAFDPRLSGAAPGAQVVSIAVAGANSSTFLEAFIRASYDPRIDIILAAASIPSIPQGGKEVHNIILDRIVTKKNKIIIVSAGNSGNMPSTVNTLADGFNVLAVGQFNSRKAKLAFYGKEETDSSNAGSSGGPLVDGRIKPDIIAPSLVISAGSDSIGDWQEVNRLACPNLRLPPRAMCGGGTSNAAPVAAGAVASLLSILKKEKRAIRAIDVVSLIRHTARHVPTIPVYLQGHGIVNIPAALNRLNSGTGTPLKFSVSAPIPNDLSHATGKAIRGRGLFEREGWHPGALDTRSISITRLNGPAGDVVIAARIIGDKSNTYSVPSRLILPLQSAVDITVSIRPEHHGIHSALLELRLEETDEVVERINLTTIASIKVSEYKNRTYVFDEIASEAQAPVFSIDIPDNTAALIFDVHHTHAYMGSLPLLGPLGGVPALVKYNEVPKGPINRSLSRSGGQVRRIVLWPAAGVWQLAVPYRAPELNSFNLKGKIFALTNEEVEKLLFKNQNIKKSEVNYQSHISFKVRKSSGAYKNGQFQSNGLLPTVIPLSLPKNASQVDVRVHASRTQTRSQSQAIAAALLGCSMGKCEYIDSALGREVAGMSHLFFSLEKLYLVVLPLGVGQKQNLINYEVFFPHPSQWERQIDIRSNNINIKFREGVSNFNYYERCSFWSVYGESQIVTGKQNGEDEITQNYDGVTLTSKYSHAILFNKKFSPQECY